MRIFVTLACLLGVVVGLGVAQEGEKQARRHFDPPSVVTAVDAIYPLNSVASGTVVLEVSLDGAGKITDIRVVRGIASLTEPAEDSVRQWTFQPRRGLCAPVDVSTGEAQWKAGTLEDRGGLLVRSS